MYWNRFDIVEAHFWFCADYHTGQSSDLYRRLGRIGRYFTPSAMSHGPTTDNARDIYNALAEKVDA
jgi:hypothetical protein